MLLVLLVGVDASHRVFWLLMWPVFDGVSNHRS